MAVGWREQRAGMVGDERKAEWRECRLSASRRVATHGGSSLGGVAGIRPAFLAATTAATGKLLSFSASLPHVATSYTCN